MGPLVYDRRLIGAMDVAPGIAALRAWRAGGSRDEQYATLERLRRLIRREAPKDGPPGEVTGR